MSKIDDRYLKEFLQTLPKEIPSVLLFHTPSMPKQGDKVDIRLEVEDNLSINIPLMIEFLTQEGDLIIAPIPVDLSSLTASFTIPETIEQGSYVLEVTYNDCFLDSTTFNIVDEESARQMAEFERGLETENQVKKSIEEGNYDKSMQLQEKAARHYAHNPKLAARSWEELAEVLYEKDQLTLSREALEKALNINLSIEGLENKQEILDRINEKIEILKPPKTKLQLLREEKGYSQIKLAVLIGVTPETIKAWEEGKELEELKQFFELANKLKCQIDDFIEINPNFDNITNKLSSKPQINSKIRSLRERNKLNQSQIASSVGKTPDIIQKWEDGEELEKLIQFFELAQVLDCKVSDLIEFVDVNVKQKLPEQLAELLSKVTDSPENSTKTKS
ncbi:helix-turn-helix domain-containing protein [Crocosphaera sp. XPORK-15E]|uniref:helix-turn-helix domain-containing protein n=1 Tax=Crocosphaera sp. XPORK-15E TaxID=3110247 RepID=UPI002B208AEC|nr:helix-turn-helix domain-containing protein [Crocosphaera sp. XPORK-15E]MEA5534563.1 helix-turn-helix domain-containing protein [Crocosphaera sp. XPORK-15E]